jgi:hypothetical protein
MYVTLLRLVRQRRDVGEGGEEPELGKEPEPNLRNRDS